MDERVKGMADQWWFNTGSRIVPDPSHDMEEHASRVCASAFAAGFAAGFAVAEASMADRAYAMMIEGRE